jgi:hypothetical protein
MQRDSVGAPAGWEATRGWPRPALHLSDWDCRTGQASPAVILTRGRSGQSRGTTHQQIDRLPMPHWGSAHPASLTKSRVFPVVGCSRAGLILQNAPGCMIGFPAGAQLPPVVMYMQQTEWGEGYD